MSRRRRGLTLIELVAVAAILLITAGIVVVAGDRFRDSSRKNLAAGTLSAVRDAIIGTKDAPGFYADTGRLPYTPGDLLVNPFIGSGSFGPTGVQPDPNAATLAVFDPATGLGWRGPYIQNDGGGQILDPWGKPLVIQQPTVGLATDQPLYTRLISGGPNKVIDTPANASVTDAFSVVRPYPVPAVRGDDIVIFLLRADVAP